MDNPETPVSDTSPKKPPEIRNISAVPDALNREMVQITYINDEGKEVTEMVNPIDATEILQNQTGETMASLFEHHANNPPNQKKADTDTHK
jgi:hypothetical protein